MIYMISMIMGLFNGFFDGSNTITAITSHR